MEQKGNGQTCWEMNPNCQRARLAGQNLTDSLICPAYDQKKSCWEIDWASYLKNKSESQKGFWKGFYNIGCRACPTCKHNQEEIENMISKINAL